MSGSKKKGTKDVAVSEQISEPIVDLIDFYARWPEFRPLVEQALKREGLSESERTVITWLKRLADRVGEADLDGGSRH
ncbi:MAG: hypothetical protein AAF441_05480 [Pseudomonadota bacterium]